jgi:hypothetical protein
LPLLSPDIFGVGVRVPVELAAVPCAPGWYTLDEAGDEAVEGIELSALLAVSGKPPKRDAAGLFALAGFVASATQSAFLA